MLTDQKMMLLSEFPFMDDDDIPGYYESHNPSGGLYFIADLEADLIKIGKSEHPFARLKAIRGELRKPHLRMMACFEHGVEQKAHRQFKALRVRGEWFTPAPELISAILLALQGDMPWKSRLRIYDRIVIKRPTTRIQFPWDAHLPTPPAQPAG